MSFYKDHDAFECLKIYVPKATAAIMKARAAEKGMPVSRLGAIAIDNELDAKSPFFYATTLPQTTTDHEFTVEGGKLLKFLKRFKTGTGRDTVILCRRDIGIESRATLLAAYKELLDVGLIEEVPPARRTYYHAADYKKVRVVEEDLRTNKKLKSLNELEEKNRAE